MIIDEYRGLSGYEITLELATRIADLREPSVPDILRMYGFMFEARVVEDLTTAVDELRGRR